MMKLVKNLWLVVIFLNLAGTAVASICVTGVKKGQSQNRPLSEFQRFRQEMASKVIFTSSERRADFIERFDQADLSDGVRMSFLSLYKWHSSTRAKVIPALEIANRGKEITKDVTSEKDNYFNYALWFVLDLMTESWMRSSKEPLKDQIERANKIYSELLAGTKGSEKTVHQSDLYISLIGAYAHFVTHYVVKEGSRELTGDVLTTWKQLQKRVKDDFLTANMQILRDDPKTSESYLIHFLETNVAVTRFVNWNP
ncbi:MAG: hypothetical protein KDD61_07005 [Bdellovibrionales bacterium]|nr:hypothetical protein [Bdellovibrionales bacterium]